MPGYNTAFPGVDYGDLPELAPARGISYGRSPESGIGALQALAMSLARRGIIPARRPSPKKTPLGGGQDTAALQARLKALKLRKQVRDLEAEDSHYDIERQNRILRRLAIRRNLARGSPVAAEMVREDPSLLD